MATGSRTVLVIGTLSDCGARGVIHPRPGCADETLSTAVFAICAVDDTGWAAFHTGLPVLADSLVFHRAVDTIGRSGLAGHGSTNENIRLTIAFVDGSDAGCATGDAMEAAADVRGQPIPGVWTDGEPVRLASRSASQEFTGSG